MQLPFYVTKTAVITREEALDVGRRLASRLDTSEDRDRQDLIDFCLGGTKTELVQLSLGTKVRLKAGKDWHYTTPAAGTVCVVSQAVLSSGGTSSEIQLKAVSDGDAQRLAFPNHITDLSEWLEVL